MTGDEDCPEWVGDAGRGEWSGVVSELAQRRMLPRVTVVQCATYCQILGQYIRATQWLEVNGYVIEVRDDKGVVKNQTIAPEFSIQKDALTRLRQYWADWGLTPKVATNAGQKRSALAGLAERLRGSGSAAAVGGAVGAAG